MRGAFFCCFVQHNCGDEGPNQVGSDGQDRCLLHWNGFHIGGHSAGGHQLPGSGIHWNLPRYVPNIEIEIYTHLSPEVSIFWLHLLFSDAIILSTVYFFFNLKGGLHKVSNVPFRELHETWRKQRKDWHTCAVALQEMAISMHGNTSMSCVWEVQMSSHLPLRQTCLFAPLNKSRHHFEHK